MKNSTNSRPCSCCHRLLANKSGKRKACGPRCARIADAMRQRTPSGHHAPRAARMDSTPRWRTP